MPTDATHDPQLRSRVEAANEDGCDFPIQNLPLGIFSTAGTAPRGGIAIGDRILDIAAAHAAGLLTGAAAAAAVGTTLNPLMALGNDAAAALRAQAQALLAEGATAALPLVPMSGATMHLPAAIGAFSDFFCSYDHTLRGGRVSRPDNPVPAAFKWLPIAYNSRASSVRPSGEDVVRPNGIRGVSGGGATFGPCTALDFELEFAAFIGRGSALGAPIPLARAREHLFGFCLLNDWSARDIQRFESTPLGPFLSKSLHTTISPWVVTAAALEPFRAAAPARHEGDPPLLPHLDDAGDRTAGHRNIALTCDYTPRGAVQGERIVATHLRNLYWTLGQMLTHHASNGCNLRPGDLIATGTVSGPEDHERACMNEMTLGKQPIRFADGTERMYLEDGDRVTFSARAEREGFVGIGFGECTGVVLPAPAWPSA